MASAPHSRRAARERATAQPAAVPVDEAGVLVDSVATIDSVAAPAALAAQEPGDTVDAFEQASRALRTVPEACTVPTASASTDTPDQAIEIPAHLAARRPRNIRKMITVGATVGVMSLAGLLAVATTLPAQAVSAAQGAPASAMLHATDVRVAKDVDADEIQAFVASPEAQNESLARENDYTTVSLIQVAAEEGIKYSNSVFTNDPNAAIQWPFKVGVGMSFGYGPRAGEFHQGIDFTPGNGAPIQAIADGTVRIATEQGGGYGVTVYIDHVIDGKLITSHYAHMQYGSLRVKVGDKVKVGQIVGRTGNTGRSYGAHLHFELLVDGHTIDPMPWLKTNAGRYSY